MHLTATAHFLADLFVARGVLAQSPYAEPPESGSPTTSTPNVTLPSYSAFIFCGAPDCSGTCAVVDADTVPKGDTHPAPNDMGFQSMYYYEPSGTSNIYLYTCLNYCEVINHVQIAELDTCYNLYNNSISTDFYTYYYIG
ncbi:hypothetical protein OG21DRAFT_787189 [Imleria badia]|nr:hypothetical protein OG21DRAFT_787189 [Imleria badia]